MLLLYVATLSWPFLIYISLQTSSSCFAFGIFYMKWSLKPTYHPSYVIVVMVVTLMTEVIVVTVKTVVTTKNFCHQKTFVTKKILVTKKLKKYKCQNNRNTTFRFTEIQITLIQKYKIQNWRHTTCTSAVIQIAGLQKYN